MTRAERNWKWLFVASIVASFSVATGPAAAATDTCPGPVPNQIPAAPPSPPALNVGTIKNLLREYHDKHYNEDVAAVFTSAQKFVEENATRSKRPALVLDIDETSLTNWPNLAADDFGFVAGGSCDLLPAGPCGFNQWILKSQAAPLTPAVALFNAAKAGGVAVIFITGRPDSQRDATIINLDRAGYDGWTELRTRHDHDDFPNVQAFKQSERIKVEAEGYTIIANVGDQQSDIDGGHGGCVFKVPNPFYFIP